jgi:hypothetical protein
MSEALQATDLGAEGAALDADPKGIKQAILTAIGLHLREHGRRRWDLLREHPAYASVIGKAAGEKGRRKFWRWVQAMTEPAPPDATRPHEARAAADEALATATDRARRAAEQNIPVAPSPAYMMRAGAKGPTNIDFLAAVSGIWADAQRLREQAMGPDETSPDGQRIEDAKMFDASIRRRTEVMESALGVMREIWDLQYQQRFYDGITAIIVDELAEVPEIQERVIRKLAELNKSRGMTVHAEVN